MLIYVGQSSGFYFSVISVLLLGVWWLCSYFWFICFCSSFFFLYMLEIFSARFSILNFSFLVGFWCSWYFSICNWCPWFLCSWFYWILLSSGLCFAPVCWKISFLIFFCVFCAIVGRLLLLLIFASYYTVGIGWFFKWLSFFCYKLKNNCSYMFSVMLVRGESVVGYFLFVTAMPDFSVGLGWFCLVGFIFLL